MLSNTFSPNHLNGVLEEYICYLKQPARSRLGTISSKYPMQGLIQLLQYLQEGYHWSNVNQSEQLTANYNLLIYGEAESDLLQEAQQEYDHISMSTHAPSETMPPKEADGLVYSINILSEESIDECCKIRAELEKDRPLTTFLIYESCPQSFSSLQWLAAKKTLILLPADTPNLSTVLLVRLHLHRSAVNHLFELIFDRLIDLKTGPRQQFHIHLDTAIEELIEHDHFSVHKLCTKLHYSRSQLSRKVRQSTGMSISHYVNHYRLEKSKVLLRTTSWSIGRIAVELGYSTQQYFSSLFRKKYDATPKYYRDNYQEDSTNDEIL